jgi:hypothetical protein
MRSDLVSGALAAKVFQEGPITGNPVDGNEMVVSLGNRVAGGEVFDRPVELSNDLAACDRLFREARPIGEMLRRDLYPNVEQFPERLRLRTGGALDGSRLALAGFSGTIFHRCEIIKKPDRRGRPVLVIACDGSGSLDPAQMRMVKVLTTAWLSSTTGSTIQLLAALYHSGQIRQGLAGPLVQWIYHPRKTPALGRGDAIRAVASLPDMGTGAQADALSLALIMKEARQLARNSMIYLILISDAQWNRSFQTDLSGQDEVCHLMMSLGEDLGDKLHSLLVVLGNGETDGVEDYLNKVIRVSDEDLQDPLAVAGRIGSYVASRIRQLRQYR